MLLTFGLLQVRGQLLLLAGRSVGWRPSRWGEGGGSLLPLWKHQRTSAGSFTVQVERVRSLLGAALCWAGVSLPETRPSWLCVYCSWAPSGTRAETHTHTQLPSCFSSHPFVYVKICSGVKFYSCAKLNCVSGHMIYQQQKQLVKANVSLKIPDVQLSRWTRQDVRTSP